MHVSSNSFDLYDEKEQSAPSSIACEIHDDFALDDALKPKISFTKDFGTKYDELNDVSWCAKVYGDAFIYYGDVEHGVQFYSCD